MGLVPAFLLLFARSARADDLQALDQARTAFDAGQYAEAHQRLAALLDPKLEPCEATAASSGCRLTSPEIIERSRALDAASLLVLKRTKDADEAIATILRQNPNYVPSPAMFPQEVIDRFTFVRGSMAAELRKIIDEQARDAEAKRIAAQKARDDQEAWIQKLEKLAAKERVIPTNSRWIALVPFGIGQFQNGDVPLGITFAVAEVLAGGTSLISVALSNSLASSNPPASLVPDANARFATYTAINRVSFAVWGAVTLAGIIHAEVTFVPEGRGGFRERSTPPRPKLVPVAAPLPRGAVFGMGGTF